MPVSRRRSKPNRSEADRRRAAKRYHESRRLAATASHARLSSRDRDTLRASADAELRGDAAEAFRLYSTIDRFDDSHHWHRLRLLAELGTEAPAWLVSRWLTMQARRPLWTGAPKDSDPPALARAVEIAYPYGVATERMQGMSMPVFASCLYEFDWVTRQLIVYDDSGLADLVERFASPQLLERADSPRAWASAPMGGYRFESDEDGCVRVTDLATGELIDLLNLGVGFQHWPGQHLLARVVPTSSGPGRMFEWRPLPVDEGTAVDVARCPQLWTDIVADHARSRQLPHDFSLMDDGADVLTDLPNHSWIAGLEKEDISRLPSVDDVIDYADVAMYLLERFVAAFASMEEVPPTLRPVMFSLVLQPGLRDEIESRLSEVRHGAGWLLLAESLAEPARSRCLGYAKRCLYVA